MRLDFDVRCSYLEETPQQKPCAVVAGYNLGVRKEISKFTNPVKLIKNLRVMKWSADQNP